MPNGHDQKKDKRGTKDTPEKPQPAAREGGSTAIPKDPPPWWPPCVPWPPGASPSGAVPGATYSPDWYKLMFGACVAALMARGIPYGDAIAICLRTFIPPAGAGGTLLPSEPPPGWPPGWPWPPSLPVPIPGGTTTPTSTPTTGAASRPIGWEAGVQKASANLKNCTPFRLELPANTSVRVDISEAGADTLTDNPGETDISINGRPVGPIIGNGFLDVSGPGTLIVHLKGPENYAKVVITAQ